MSTPPPPPLDTTRAEMLTHDLNLTPEEVNGVRKFFAALKSGLYVKCFKCEKWKADPSTVAFENHKLGPRVVCEDCDTSGSKNQQAAQTVVETYAELLAQQAQARQRVVTQALPQRQVLYTDYATTGGAAKPIDALVDTTLQAKRNIDASIDRAMRVTGVMSKIDWAALNEPVRPDDQDQRIAESAAIAKELAQEAPKFGG